MGAETKKTRQPFLSYKLSEQESKTLIGLCETSGVTPEDNLNIITSKMRTAATNGASQLPELIRTLALSIDEATTPGLTLLEDLPIVRDARRLTLLIGWLLGEVTKDGNEGDYVIEIKDQGTAAGQRPGFNNSREFFLHTDLSYVPEPPRFFLLHSISNDEAGGGISEFCHIRSALDGLGNLAITQLQQPNYEFPAPLHYQAGGAAVVRHPILWRNSEALPWRIRFRRDNLHSVTRHGIDAVVSLIGSMRESLFEKVLAPNSIALVDNWFLLHGRTAYAARPEPRHLNRIYVNPRKELSHDAVV